MSECLAKATTAESVGILAVAAVAAVIALPVPLRLLAAQVVMAAMAWTYQRGRRPSLSVEAQLMETPVILVAAAEVAAALRLHLAARAAAVTGKQAEQ